MQQESIKSLLALVFIAGFCVAAVAIATREAREPMNWPLVLSSGAVAVVSLALLLRMQFRRDREPDFLRQAFGQPFEADGLCFVIFPIESDGRCYFVVCYQNRYARSCRAEVVIRPTKYVFKRRQIETLRVDIECGGGELGMLRIPLPVPESVWGKKQLFDIGAGAEYPEGHGPWLRSREGASVGELKLSLGQTALTLAGAMGGAIVWSTPARIKLKLPAHVDEDIDDDTPIDRKTLWRPSDPVEGVVEKLTRCAM